jgi:Tol biopolymer transport system component/DNA-binding winged helix-turn-helix (wHTH) protein
MTERKCLVFSFAEIEVREREFSILRNGEVLPVEPKTFRVLLVLLRNPHKLITKDELLDAVWGDTAVTENSLSRSIAQLRKLLGDDTHEPRYIATVPTVGYRFLCDVKAAEDGQASLASLNATPPDETDAEAPPEQPPITPPARKSRRPLRAFAAGFALVLIAAAGFLVRRTFSSRNGHQSSRSVSAASIPPAVALTNIAGNISDPAFSPDGKQIAFIWDGENPVKGDLYIQLVGGERPLRLTRTTSGYICCANWSPDGTEIAFGRCQDGTGGVYIVPALGGPERKLTDVVCPFGHAGQPQWTADGKSLILADSCAPNGPRGIVVFSLETGAKRCLHAPGPFSDAGDGSPSLSPDHATVAFIETSTLGNDEIYTISLSADQLRRLTHGKDGIGPIMWTPDGQHIVFRSSRNGGTPWRVSTDDGVIEPEAEYPSVGVLANGGGRFAYVKGSGISPIVWRADLARPAGKPVSLRKNLFQSNVDDSAQLSPDGRQVVYRTRSARGCLCGDTIWRSDADGGNPVQLTFIDEGFTGSPRWSPDLKWIVYDYHVGQHSQIYMIDSEGRNQHTVASGDYENVVPNFSRDGKSIYFASNRTHDWQIWKRDLSSGQETEVTRHGGFLAIESYDGRTLYYSKFEDGGLWSIPVGGGPEERVTTALHRGYWGHFAVTDSGIYLLDVDATPRPTIMYYSFQKRKLTPVFQMEEHPVPWVANLSASRDGLTLLFAQWTPQSQIEMVENLPQPSDKSEN